MAARNLGDGQKFFTVQYRAMALSERDSSTNNKIHSKKNKEGFNAIIIEQNSWAVMTTVAASIMLFRTNVGIRPWISFMTAGVGKNQCRRYGIKSSWVERQRYTKQCRNGTTSGTQSLSSFSSVTSGGEGSNSINRNSIESNREYFAVGITGSGGLIGTALRNELSRRSTLHGKPIRIIQLKRGSKAESIISSDTGSKNDDGGVTTMELTWNPNAANAADVIDPKALEDMDAVIHLSGENISTGLSGPLAFLGIRPWTPEKKREIINSRVVTTSALARAIENLNGTTSKENGISFLVASGVGAYGSHFVGPNVSGVDETTDTSKSEGFLAEVSRQWEAATESASKNDNCRVAILRNGVVLSTKGGALAKLYPIFLLGGGGIVGSGDQYFPFISARDMARAMVHVLETPTLDGPINMCAPGDGKGINSSGGGCTNLEFTKAFGRVLSRPTILPFPSFAVSLLFGEMGEEVLLGGTRAFPKKLVDSGFKFLHPTIDDAVKSAVNETI